MLKKLIFVCVISMAVNSFTFANVVKELELSPSDSSVVTSLVTGASVRLKISRPTGFVFTSVNDVKCTADASIKAFAEVQKDGDAIANEGNAVNIQVAHSNSADTMDVVLENTSAGNIGLSFYVRNNPPKGNFRNVNRYARKATNQITTVVSFVVVKSCEAFKSIGQSIYDFFV